MAPTTVLDYTTYYDDDTVEAVVVRETDSPEHPSGWDYSLHYGTLDGERFLRYDNAHERTKGHERHTPEGVEEIDFPGMVDLYDRFQSEIAEVDWVGAGGGE